MAPGYNQYLITERYNANIRVYENDELRNRINVEIENKEHFVCETNFGLWNILFDPSFNGIDNRTIYISLGVASPDIFGPQMQRVGLHAIVQAEYDPMTASIVGLSGDILRTPTQLCPKCPDGEICPERQTPIVDERSADIPALPESAIIFESTRDPARITDPEHTDGMRFTEGSNGGQMIFLPDNTLLFTIGYVHQRLVSQDVTLFDGKIIRMTRDGRAVCGIAGVEDNPFCDSNHPVTQYIYTYGHKNNQGLAFDTRTGQLYAAEHGEVGGDEINIIVRGNNYGYPYITNGSRTYLDGDFPSVLYPLPADRTRSDFTLPVFSWNFSATSTASGDIYFYDHPNSFQNSLFVALLASRSIQRIYIDDNGNPHLIETVVSGNRFRSMVSDDEGYIYLLADIGGKLYKVRVVE